MKLLPIFFALLLTAPLFHITDFAAADDPPTCTPVGPCVPLQRQYDDLVTNNLEALGSLNVGWINAEPGNIRFQPLLDLPPQLAGNALTYADRLSMLASGAAEAVLADVPATAGTVTTWVLGTVDAVPGRATASALAIAGSGDRAIVVIVTEGGAWVAFVNAQGVVVASEAVSLATHSAGSAATVSRAVNGGAPYIQRKALEAAERIVRFVSNPPTDAVERDVDENGLGDTWEDTICRSRMGVPGLPADACEQVGDLYHILRSYATADFDGDYLDLIDEFRWNSDPLDPDTDKDGLPDGPEADLWRRSENDLVVQANLWTCPTSPEFADSPSCAWRHPDSFRDDDGDGLFNMGQDPAGPLSALGAGDRDSENDGLSEGNEYYGCLTNPIYGANPHADPDVPSYSICGGSEERGHDADVLETDTDGDGLTDYEEVCSAEPGPCARLSSYDTDPLNFDTDGDTWADGAEAAFWRDHGGWFHDIDADGTLNNLADPDSDRDGIQDGVEILYVQGALRPDLWDTDVDTMPDQWEIRNGFGPLNPADGGVMDPTTNRCATATADADSDQLCNAFEYAFQRPAGWSETTMGEWTSVLNPLAGDADGDNLVDRDEIYMADTERYAQQHPSTPQTYGGKYYYRWDAAYGGYLGSTRVDLADTDGDLVDDRAERNDANGWGHYSNPNAPDSDLDGARDNQEVTSDTANWDTDGDGIQDGEELPECANATDCDNDQLADGDEADHGCTVGDQDSDDDGLRDGWEIHGTFGPATKCHDAYTDGDGFTDGEEVQTYLTDPTNADMDGDGLRDDEEVLGARNAGHTATHAARGDYAFGMDRCVSPVAVRCAAEGATDPTVRDTDRDGLPDGAEVNGVYKSSDCEGQFCPLWFLNPNLNDTDGDNPPGATNFNDTNERNRRSAYAQGSLANPPYDPTHFDPDGDGLADPREFAAVTDPFQWDTDHDRIGDAAELVEGGFGSDPRRANTDADSALDLGDHDVARDSDPPLLLAWRTLDGDARKGTCLAAADQSTVTFTVKRLVAWHFRDPSGSIPSGSGEEEDSLVVVPEWRTYDGLRHACLSYAPVAPGSGFTMTLKKAEVTMTDQIGNHAAVAFDTVADAPDVVGWLLAEQVLCYVPFVGSIYSMAVHVGDDAQYAKGLAGFSLETLTLDGIPVPANAKRAFKALGPAMCVLDNIAYLAGRAAATEWQATATSESNPEEMYTFSMQGGRRGHLAVKGEAFAATLPDGSTVWRGHGLPFLQAKHAQQAFSAEEWQDRVGLILSTGNYAEECRNNVCYTVVSIGYDGLRWTIYVHKDSVVDVELASV